MASSAKVITVGTHIPSPIWKGLGGTSNAPFLLIEDHLLDRGAALAAPFLGPCDLGVTGGGFLRLPGLGRGFIEALSPSASIASLSPVALFFLALAESQARTFSR